MFCSTSFSTDGKRGENGKQFSSDNQVYSLYGLNSRLQVINSSRYMGEKGALSIITRASNKEWFKVSELLKS